MPQIPNYEHIKGNTFLVWTQAGFRKAMNLSNEENETYQGRYPQRYPAVVTFLMSHYPDRLTCRVEYIEDLERIIQINEKHRRDLQRGHYVI